LDVVGYYWFILTSVATGCYWFLTKMMDFGWILIDAIDLTLVDKMDFGGLWLIWGLFHVVSNVLKFLPVFLGRS